METNYQLLDSGHFKKWEKVGPYFIVRPALGAVWSPHQPIETWKADAEFERNSSGKGKWRLHKRLPDSWSIDLNGLTLEIQLTDFGHLGLFAEHASNWDQLVPLCQKWSQSNDEVRVLNLFAYTGGVTLACAKGGASVTHLDASKTSVAWARKNAELSALSERPIRWIVDDVSGFVERELRRGKTYHGVVLDPPSFGRGSKGQLWKIEEHLIPLLESIKTLLVPENHFVLLSSHSPGYTPMALENLLAEQIGDGVLTCREMFVIDQNKKRLPSGAQAFLVFDKLHP
ncbi:MAG: class I SAM-dependent methyltransferase [Bdellovibrionales bacterium]|nr:class I SAM-dependent methyltransferase [Bdellovibrionales bacterium]